MDEETILTTNEVAKYLNVSIMSISRMAREGEIPAFRVRGQWRFRKSMIDNWILEKERESKEVVNS